MTDLYRWNFFLSNPSAMSQKAYASCYSSSFFLRLYRQQLEQCTWDTILPPQGPPDVLWEVPWDTELEKRKKNASPLWPFCEQDKHIGYFPATANNWKGLFSHPPRPTHTCTKLAPSFTAFLKKIRPVSGLFWRNHPFPLGFLKLDI